MIYNIHFTDFWSSFDIKNNFFTNILKKKIKLVCNYEKDPDILIFGMFGQKNQNSKYKNCFKIFYSGESFTFSKYWNEIYEADIYLTMYSDLSKFTDKNLKNKLQIQFHLYDMYNIIYNKYNFNNSMNILNKCRNNLCNKENFCLFMVANTNVGKGAKIRIELFNKLNKYKKVHSAGRSLNNGYKVKAGFENKIEFLKKYKFCISFENLSEPDYISEKIWEPLIAGAIPIYYGADNIYLYFNKNNFINYKEFNNLDELVNFIIDVDNDDSKYMSYFNDTPIINQKNYNNILDQIIFKLNECI